MLQRPLRAPTIELSLLTRLTRAAIEIDRREILQHLGFGHLRKHATCGSHVVGAVSAGDVELRLETRPQGRVARHHCHRPPLFPVTGSGLLDGADMGMLVEVESIERLEQAKPFIHTAFRLAEQWALSFMWRNHGRASMFHLPVTIIARMLSQLWSIRRRCRARE